MLLLIATASNQAQRWSYAEKKRVTIMQPHLIDQHNGSVRGEDPMYQNVAAYRLSIRSKKCCCAGGPSSRAVRMLQRRMLGFCAGCQKGSRNH